MTGRIKGITIEIGGDTQKLSKAMKQINAESKTMQNELKQVEKLLKLDPGNTELLAQKQQILTEAIKATEERLKALQKADENAKQQLANGEISQEQYRELQREVIRAEQDLKRLEEQAKKCNVALEHAAAVTAEFGNKTTDLGKKIAPASAAVTGLGAAAVKVGMDFDTSMSQVAATMGITAEEIASGSEAYELLRQSAKDAGATTAFSASEAAEALNYLALAGYDAEKASAALVPILNLAAAGSMELAEASDMVTDSMSALGIEATTENLIKFGDEMVKASQKSNTSVSQLGAAYLTVGGTAKQLAGGTNELATALGVLADNGIKGAEGGTALRNIILALTPTTEPAAQAFDTLGISAYDADGNFKPLKDTLKELNVALSDATQEERMYFLNDMFNKVDLKSVSALLAATATNVDELTVSLEAAGITFEETGMNITVLQKVFREAGSQEEFIEMLARSGITAEQAQVAYIGLDAVLNGTGSRFDELSGYIADSSDAMQDAADTQLANLEGQLKIVSSQLQDLGIDISELLMPAIMAIVAAIQSAISWIDSLDDGTKQIIVTVGLIIAALGPLLILIGKMATGISAVISVLPVVMAALNALVPVFVALSSPIGVVIAVIASLILAFTHLWNSSEEFRDNFKTLWEGLLSFTRMTLNNLKTLFTNIFSGILSGLNAFGNSAKEAIRNILQALLSILQSIAPNMTAAGQNMFQHLLQGMQSVWDSIQSFVSSKVSWLTDKLTFWRNSQSEMSGSTSGGGAGRSIDGSHAGGLSYVPFDGYIAQLHKGERVLTAGENMAYTNNQNSGNVQNTFYVQATIREEADVEKVAQKLHSMQKADARGRGITFA